jgi:hypothetical protein
VFRTLKDVLEYTYIYILTLTESTDFHREDCCRVYLRNVGSIAYIGMLQVTSTNILKDGHCHPVMWLVPVGEWNFLIQKIVSQ